MTKSSTESVATVQMLHERRDEIERIALKHGASNVRVFGSVARGEDKSDSDVDLLVDVTSTPSSWFPTGLILELEDLLQRRVDVVTERALHALIREQVLREVVTL